MTQPRFSWNASSANNRLLFAKSYHPEDGGRFLIHVSFAFNFWADAYSPSSAIECLSQAHLRAGSDRRARA